jgi:hypothetical protein
MREEIPDWTVERLAAGDLPRGEADALRTRLAARGDARLARIADHNAAFVAAHPAAIVAAEIRRRSARRISPLVFAIPALAAIVLVLWFVRGSVTTREQPEETRLKGQVPHLVIYKKTAHGPQRLADRARVRPGDTVQVAYIAAAKRFGVIVSIDAAGLVSLHLPEVEGSASRLARGEIAVPHAFVLDDSPGFERFVLVTADRAFSTADAVAVARGATLPELAASELVLEKDAP